jgi:hypothetical protein
MHPCIIVQFIKKNATMYQNFIILYLYEAQHVLGDTLPIIRSLKLHCSLWFFIRGRLLGRVVVGHGQAVPDNVHQPSTYEKPEAASAVLGS